MAVKSKPNVMVLGANGMLGHVVARAFSSSPNYKTAAIAGRISDLPGVFHKWNPDIVINCIGVVKTHPDIAHPHKVFAANAVLPHRLLTECAATGARLIHISTDCVFSGLRGGYVETDAPDAQDLYGVSKMLGEVSAPNAVVIRTSMIGHELNASRGLLEWFLKQRKTVTGYSRARFSGMTTIELAKVIRDVIVPHQELFGTFHVTGPPISKYDLLLKIQEQYGAHCDVTMDDQTALDRTLRSHRFRVLTGYTAPSWQTMIQEMCRVR